MFPRVTDVVKHLLIINILIFVIVHIIFNGSPALMEYFTLFHPKTGAFKPLQVITSMFNHANFNHLLFNMLGLYFLGPMVEHGLGSKRFFILYMLSGLGAAILHLLVISSAGGLVGASGAIFGVTAAFATMFPNVELMLMFIPIPIKAKYLVGGILVLSLIATFMGLMPGIAHLAHVGGAIVGFLLVLIWKKANLR